MNKLNFLESVNDDAIIGECKGFLLCKRTSGVDREELLLTSPTTRRRLWWSGSPTARTFFAALPIKSDLWWRRLAMPLLRAPPRPWKLYVTYVPAAPHSSVTFLNPSRPCMREAHNNDALGASRPRQRCRRRGRPATCTTTTVAGSTSRRWPTHVNLLDGANSAPQNLTRKVPRPHRPLHLRSQSACASSTAMPSSTLLPPPRVEPARPEASQCQRRMIRLAGGLARRSKNLKILSLAINRAPAPGTTPRASS